MSRRADLTGVRTSIWVAIDAVRDRLLDDGAVRFQPSVAGLLQSFFATTHELERRAS